MEATIKEKIESLLASLPPEEKVAIISHGVALYLSSLKKRLSLAQAKVRQFEERYRISLSELDAQGLPDDADYQMHEDYIMWHHWADTVEKLQKQIAALSEIAAQGLYSPEMLHVGD